MTFDQIYQANVGFLLHIAKSFRLSDEQAEEIVQEVFLKFYEKKDEIPSDRIRPYLAVMTKNLCLDHYRREKVRKTDAVDTFEDKDQLSPLWQGDRSRGRLLHSVYQAVMEIADDDSTQEFRKYYLEGKTLVHIAKEQGEPKGTIQARVHRTRKRLESRIRQLITTIQDSHIEEVML